MEVVYILSFITAVIALITAVIVFITKTLAERRRTVIATDALRNHSLFRTLIMFRLIVLQKFRLADPIKTKIFKDILINKIDVWGFLLSKLAKDIDERCDKSCQGKQCKVSVGTLYELNTDVFNTGCHEYETYFENDKNYSREEKEVLRHAMTLFSEHHKSNVCFVEKSIGAIVVNSKYTSCAKILQSQILTAYESAFNNTIHDIEKAMNDANGWFKDKTFEKKNYSFVPEWTKKI